MKAESAAEREDMNLKTLAIVVLGTMLLTIGVYRTIESNMAIKPCVNVTGDNAPILPNMPREGQEGIDLGGE